MKKFVLSLLLIFTITGMVFAVICPVCKTNNPDGAKFCSGCGAKLEPPAPTYIFCPQCGAKNLSTAKFCAKCGYKLSGSAPKAQKAAPVQPAQVAPVSPAPTPAVVPASEGQEEAAQDLSAPEAVSPAPAQTSASPAPAVGAQTAPVKAAQINHSKPRQDSMFAKHSTAAHAVVDTADDDSAGIGLGVNYVGASLRIYQFELKYQVTTDTNLLGMRIYKGSRYYYGWELGYANSTIATGIETGMFFGIHRRFDQIGVYFDAGPYLVDVWQKNSTSNSYGDFGIIFNSGVNYYFN